jgi:hypothetical protein
MNTAQRIHQDVRALCVAAFCESSNAGCTHHEAPASSLRQPGRSVVGFMQGVIQAKDLNIR